MSAYTVSQLAHNAGVSVHIVRDYRCAACYGRWPAPRAATACSTMRPCNGCAPCARPSRRVSARMPLARLCRALDAADGAQAAAQLAVLRQLVERRRAALAHLDAQLASMPAERAHEEALP